MKTIGLAGIAMIMLIMACTGNRSVDQISASGTIEATEVRVCSKVNGELIRVVRDEGSEVMPGDTIAVIDHSMFDIQMEQAQAVYRLAEAQYELVLKGARHEDLNLGGELLKQAEANLEIARKDFERIQALFDSQSVTSKMRDDAEARYKIVLSQYESARQSLQKLRNLARPEEIRSAKARLDQAAAAVSLIAKGIRDCHVVATQAGLISQRPFEVGELITLGAPIAVITHYNPLDLLIYVNAIELGYIKLGQAAEVSIDSYPNRIFPGRVVYIASEAEFTPKNVQTQDDRVKLVYKIKIKVENPEGFLKSGMLADAKILIHGR
ncbi:MAG: efflux RND transporter periplasmic adaptor subunit [Candidatus Delongbacteria bacterium]|nr:efflux RND transporter periplasmic adaptor subunit [Candidatus Delongbacteria bacterium]